MKKISSRAIVTTLLSVLVVVGLGAFVIQYFFHASFSYWRIRNPLHAIVLIKQRLTMIYKVEM